MKLIIEIDVENKHLATVVAMSASNGCNGVSCRDCFVERNGDFVDQMLCGLIRENNGTVKIKHEVDSRAT